MYNINLTIFWIRHGFSCANLLAELGKAGIGDIAKNIFRGTFSDSRGELAPDAKLTDKTIKIICGTKLETEKIKPVVDLILCSELTRAIETAMFVFRNEGNPLNIHVSPFIGEKRLAIAFGTDRDNVSSSLKDLDSNIQNIKAQYNQTDSQLHAECSRGGKLFLPDVDLSIIAKFREANNNKPTTPNFIRFIEEIIPYLCENASTYFPTRDIPKEGTFNLTLAIVSHHHYIKEVTGIQFIDNLDIIRHQMGLQYNIDSASQNMKVSYATPQKKMNTSTNRCENSTNPLGEEIQPNNNKSCIWGNKKMQPTRITENSVEFDAPRCGEKVIRKIMGERHGSNRMSHSISLPAPASDKRLLQNMPKSSIELSKIQQDQISIGLSPVSEGPGNIDDIIKKDAQQLVLSPLSDEVEPIDKIFKKRNLINID